jgi:enolase
MPTGAETFSEAMQMGAEVYQVNIELCPPRLAPVS